LNIYNALIKQFIIWFRKMGDSQKIIKDTGLSYRDGCTEKSL